MKIRYFLPILICLAFPAKADGIGSALTGVIRSSGCSQSTTFLARTAGLNGTHQAAYTALICGMVTDGTWCGSLFDAIYVFATQNSTTALLNLCSSSFNLTANGSPTFTADAGFTGVDASTTVYLDPGADLTTYTDFQTNSAHISAWSFTNAASTGGGGVVQGGYDGGFQVLLFPRYFDGNAYCNLSENNTTGFASSDSSGWFVCDRTDSTHSTLYRNGSLIGTPNATSQSVPAVHPLILASAQAGTNPAFGSALQLGAATIGSHISSANVTLVYNRLCTYLTTVHGSC